MTTVISRHLDSGRGISHFTRRGRGVRRVCAVGAAACLTLVLGACTGDDPGTTPTLPNTAPPLTAPPPSPAATPAPAVLDPEEAEASAAAAVQEYLALFDEISADPDRDVAELEQVAGGRALEWATHQITTWRDAGQTGVGTQIVSGLVVTAADLEPDNTDGWNPSVEITACVDLSDTDLVDDNGDSVVPGERPDRVLIDFAVADLGWPDDQQWRVVRDDDQLTDSDPPEFVPCP